MAVQTKIQVRRDTAANWTSTNPTLASGEIGFESDTLKFKIGNGSTAWNSLAHQNASTSAQNYAQTLGTKTLVTTGATLPYTIVSVTITTSGAPVLIMASGDAENLTANTWCRIQLFRGTTAIGNDIQAEGTGGSENSPYAIQVVDAQAAGTYTYHLKITAIAGGNFNFGENTGPVITAIELNSLAGSANLASNLASGAAGSLPYQSASNTTTFLARTATNNQVLTFNSSTNAPYWSNVAQVTATVSGTNSADLVYGNMADNDQFRIRIGGTATNAGFVEIATADDGTEPIYVRQYTGVFSTLARTATILDGSGNTLFPGTVTAPSFVSNVATGTAPFTVSSNTMVTNLNADLLEGYSPATANGANTIVLRDASGNFAANTITATLFGRANLATYIVGGAAGSIPYQNAANSTTFLAGATGTNSFLIYASGAPFWSGPTSSMAYLSGFSSYATAAGATSLDNTSSYYQQFTGTTTQTVILPNTATLRAGWTFHIVNNSTGNVTANTFSNTATLLTIPAGTTAMVTCINALSNTSTGWEFGLTDFSTYTGSSAVVMNTSPTLATPILANSTTTATAGLREFDGTVFYSTTSTTPGKALDVASYYYVSSAQYVIDSTSASLPLSLLGASGTGITVPAGTTYEYEGLFVISASFIVTSQTPTINLISTTVSGSPVLAHQTVVESGNNTTGLGSASTLSAYRFTSTGIALTALTTGNRYYTVKMRGRIAVTGTGTIEIYPSIRFSAGSADNAWIVEPGSIFKMTPIGNGTVTTVGTWA